MRRRQRSEKNWQHNGLKSRGALQPFFKFPATIRKVIYTTNAIESLNYSVRKITKNRQSFPSADAAMKLLFMALQNISKRWTMPIRDWGSAMNQFAILYGDRVPL